MSTSSWGIFDQWRKGLLGFSDPIKERELNEDGTYGSSANLSNRTNLRRGQTERSNLSTAGGVEPSGNTIQRTHRGRGNFSMTNNTSSVPFQNRMTGKGPQVNKNISRAERSQNLARKNPNVENVDKFGNVTYKQNNKQPILAKDSTYKDNIMMGGLGTKEAENLSVMQKLANWANVDMDKAMASWKEKGGFEGLMANPAFTMGLAFMQAGAEGKNIGEGALDNVMKAAGISSHYKKILKSREEAPIEVTATDVAEVKSLLNTMNISSPSNAEKFFGFLKGKKNMQFKWDLASEEIAVELQKEIKKLKKNKKPGAPEVVYDTTKKLQILKRMFNEGRFKKEGGTWFTDATLQTTQEIPTLDNRAEGGPVNAGQPYIVGEKGPEIVIPHSDGNVLTNDDSQIFSMLLASNPQLQNVSRQRAEKILRSRFPEYFE